MDIFLGEGEERGLCGLVGGFEILGNLIEGLSNPRIVAHDGMILEIGNLRRRMKDLMVSPSLSCI